MGKHEYLQRALDAYQDGRISEEVYENMIANVEIFCEEDDECGLPRTYAEAEYDDFDNAEAVEGARFDDRNYQRYMER